MEMEREREAEVKMAANNNNNNNNCLSDTSSTRLWSLLASNDRDFLLTSNDTQVKVSELEGKVVGIYFSANWYTPCKNFNQLLISIYEQLKGQGYNFEVVMVSSDEDLSAFNDYRASMPWLSVPFSDLETRRALSQTFNVEAIPCLVVLQPNKNEANNATLYDGVEVVYRYGIHAFPFTKEKLKELRKEDKEKEEMQTLVNLLTNHGRDYVLGHLSSHKVSVTSLEGKTIGLYFSAQWCPPCVTFTPKLISIYRKIKQNLGTIEVNYLGQDFEIVFVSSDRDPTSFNSYFGTMPWLALPYGDLTIKELAKHFDVREIPSLVILGPDGKTVSKQGRNLMNLYQENGFPFTESRLELLEKQMDEEAKNLPRTAFHMGHHHELNLVSQGPFICCQCDEQGSAWAYQCLECGYEVHTKCAKPVERPNS